MAQNEIKVIERSAAATVIQAHIRTYDMMSKTKIYRAMKDRNEQFVNLLRAERLYTKQLTNVHEVSNWHTNHSGPETNVTTVLHEANGCQSQDQRIKAIFTRRRAMYLHWHGRISGATQSTNSRLGKSIYTIPKYLRPWRVVLGTGKLYLSSISDNLTTLLGSEVPSIRTLCAKPEAIRRYFEPLP